MTISTSQSLTHEDGTVVTTKVVYGLKEVTDEFGRKGLTVPDWETSSMEHAQREAAKSSRWAVAARTVTTVTGPWVDVAEES